MKNSGLYPNILQGARLADCVIWDFTHGGEILPWNFEEIELGTVFGNIFVSRFEVEKTD